MVTETTVSMNVPNILIVDDAFQNLELLSGMLRKRGYEPRPVLNGKLALSAAQADPPDLILLDINMPEMNGFDVCRQLKADNALREIPVIFITGLVDAAEKVKAFSVGAVDYITKPFQFDEVHARVEAHLQLRRRTIELQQALDKLREQERLRDNLVHMIVHDMRSPLSVILGNLEMLAEMESVTTARFPLITDAWKSTQTLTDMIDTLLDVSRMEAGQLTPLLAAVDLGALVKETMSMFEPLKSQRVLTFEARGGLSTLQVDARLISRVLQNLIGNAVKFTDRGVGRVAVAIDAGSDRGIRVSVTDNGSGIPAVYHEKIFDKFYQLTVPKGGQAYSTGLGLTFCKLAVEAHRGRIGLESEVGKGTTFWFELPAGPTQ